MNNSSVQNISSLKANENLLNCIRIQWQLGEWLSLYQLDERSIKHHPDRAELALFAAAGRLHLMEYIEAYQYIRIAQNWGASKQKINQILIAGVHYNLGRIALLSNKNDKAMEHYTNTIAIGTPESEVSLMTQVLLDKQIKELGIIDVHYISNALKNKKFLNSFTQIRNEREKLRSNNEFLEMIFNKDSEINTYKKLKKIRYQLLFNNETKFKEEIEHSIKIKWIKKNNESWLIKNIDSNIHISFTEGPLKNLIEYIANKTNNIGDLPLWEGYSEFSQEKQKQITRKPNQVRIGSALGSLFTWITCKRKPSLIVEIGTALGVSSMFWSAGLEMNKSGKLISFEPNSVWHKIAKKNIEIISSKADIVCSTVEKGLNVIKNNNEKIDILFIDAIHTDEAVTFQLELMKPFLNKNALVIIDDINFSENMNKCWMRLSVSTDIISSLEIKGRIGILEY